MAAPIPVVHPPLTPDQQALVVSVIGLVKHMARKKAGDRSFLREPYEDAGIDAAILAAYAYDGRPGVKFSTLAFKAIRNGMAESDRYRNRKRRAGAMTTWTTTFWDGSNVRGDSGTMAERMDDEAKGRVLWTAAPSFPCRLDDGEPDFEGLLVGLEPRAREAVRLRYRDRLGHREIERRLGLTRGHARLVLGAAIRFLRKADP